MLDYDAIVDKLMNLERRIAELEDKCDDLQEQLDQF
jgi:hypothetical protein